MRVLVPMTVVSVIVLAAFGSWAWQQKSNSTRSSPSAGARSANANPPLIVDVHEVVREPFEQTVPATGTLLARESVKLVSELSRRLLRVRAAEGVEVKEGAPLFELDSADLRADLERVDVQIRLAKANAERQKALLAEGLTSKQEFDRTEADLDVLRAQRSVLEVTLSKTTIRAPFSGTLGLRQVSEGAWVSPNTVLASFQDTSTLKLDFTLPERYTAEAIPGREFRFKVASRVETLHGRIAAREPLVDATSRSVLVRGIVDNAKDLLPGTFATVELPLRNEQAFLVPQIAVIPSVEGRRVFVLREGVARLVPVELGGRTPDRVQVLSGLSAGDRVIVNNLLRLRDGAPVSVKASAVPVSAGRTP